MSVIPTDLLQTLHLTGLSLFARDTLLSEQYRRLDGWYANLFDHGQTLRFYESLVAVYLLRHFKGWPIVEIGSGVGFFAVLMAMMDFDVYSVEENLSLVSLQSELLNDMGRNYPYRRAVITTDPDGSHLTFCETSPRLNIIPGSFPDVKGRLPQEAILVFGNAPETHDSARRGPIIDAAHLFRFILFDANQFYCYFPDDVETSLSDFRKRGLYPERVEFLQYGHRRFFPLDFPVSYYLIDSTMQRPMPWNAGRAARDLIGAFWSVNERSRRATIRGEVVSISDDTITGWIEHSSKREADVGIRLTGSSLDLNKLTVGISYSANGVHNFIASLSTASFPTGFLREEIEVYATASGSADIKMTVSHHVILELSHKYIK